PPGLAFGPRLEARVLREAGVTLRYAVGIDLGTSNSALAYADLEQADPGVEVFEVPQLVDAALTQGRKLLPSHLYLPSAHEALGDLVVGAFARDRGAQVPGRHIASAKSWLCHPSVDRTAAILPWGAPPEVPRLSPVAASAGILRHLRQASGDHLLLGGDNMDMALARTAEQRLGERLNAARFGALVQACRAAKELLLAEPAPERTAVAVPGVGSRLIGGTVSTELGRDEVRALLLDGFFPRAAAGEGPARAARSAGLAELGLPYAADPAITRHAPALLAERLTEVISSWSNAGVRRLRNDAPDLAVARGAATYALVRRGLGLRIGGGSPRSYYVGVGEVGEAVCVVPRGAAEGAAQALDRDFSLV